MDKNSIIGFVLIFALVFAYIIYNQDQAQETLAEQKRIEDSLAYERLQDSLANQPVITGNEGDTQSAITPRRHEPLEPREKASDKPGEKTTIGPLGKSMEGNLQLDTIGNELINVVLSNKGGKIYSVEVKGYQTFTGEPLVLFDDGDNRFGYGLPAQDNFYDTDSFYFERIGSGFEVSGTDSSSITYRLRVGKDQFLENTYSLAGNSGFVHLDTRLVGFDQFLASRSTKVTLNWATKLRLQEREYEREREYSSVYYSLARKDDVDYISGDEVRDEPVKFPMKWVSFKQQFFNSTLITDDDAFTSGSIWNQTPGEDSYLKHMATKLYLPYEGEREKTYNLRFYFGPNGYTHLKKFDLGMEEMVPMGTWGLGIINKYIILPVFNFFGRFTSNYGIIILLLAIFIKVILSPLTFKSFKSSAKMRVLKPEIQELQEKYKGDAQKIQMEQMKLYRKTGVNMFGGCLPLLLQMPILIAMYRFFPASINLRQAGFLWASDLSTYDSIATIPEIPFYGAHISLFTLLMAASSILYAKFNQQMTPQAGANPAIKYMPYIMPVFLLFIFNSFSAGLTYYYLLYNVLSFGQQALFNKFFIDEDKIRKQLEARKKKPVKKSKWQKRLEEMQKLQEQQKRQKKRK